jgi:hypothetical protein
VTTVAGKMIVLAGMTTVLAGMITGVAGTTTGEEIIAEAAADTSHATRDLSLF